MLLNASLFAKCLGIHQWNSTLPLLRQYFVSWGVHKDGNEHAKVSQRFSDEDKENGWTLQFTFWAYPFQQPGTKVKRTYALCYVTLEYNTYNVMF